MSPADLRASRKSLGLTQKGLAKALRMGTHGWQSISKWESDNNDAGVPGPVQVAVELLLLGDALLSHIDAIMPAIERGIAAEWKRGNFVNGPQFGETLAAFRAIAAATGTAKTPKAVECVSIAERNRPTPILFR